MASLASTRPPRPRKALSARVVAVASALGGMFITALLLGIVSDAVGDYVYDQEGTGDALETNHSSIRLERQDVADRRASSNANGSEGGGVIVILAEMEKERQEAIAEFEYESLGTRDL